MRRGFKVTPTIRKKINTLAKAVGCTLNWHRGCGIAWNKKDIACKGEDASDIIHDIAHFAVSSKKEKNHFDFGLGTSPSTDDLYDEVKRIYSYSKCDKIEAKASALGIHWEKKLGLNWESTAEYHSWTSRYGRSRGDDFDELKQTWRNIRRTINKYDLRYILAEKMMKGKKK
jgi:hypothetical protein